MKDLMNREIFDLGDVFDDLFRPTFFDKKILNMRTDIKETPEAFELDIDLPGFKKNEIDVTLRNGYLTVSAKKQIENCDCDDDCECGCKETGVCHCDDKKEHKEHEHEAHQNKKHNYVRRERIYSSSRSYYVGDKVMEEQIKAKYDNGVLTLTVPKEKPKELNTHKILID